MRLRFFDPDPGSPEMVEFMMGGGSITSGEPLPELSSSATHELDQRLRLLSLRIFRSPGRMEGWEDAYNAFAEAFTNHGAQLTERQIQIDLPNMLFNCAVVNNWFQHLTLLAKPHELPSLTSPKRMGPDGFCQKSNTQGLKQFSRKLSRDWFYDRIRPAVIERSLRITGPPDTNQVQTDLVSPMAAATEGKAMDLISPIEAAAQYKKTEGLTWANFAKRVEVHENTLRQRICNPEYTTPIKKATLELLAKRVGGEWSDYNWPRKNEKLIRVRS